MLESISSLISAGNLSNRTEDAAATNACVCELAPPHIMFRYDYHAYNLYLIVIALPLVATFGIVTNVISFLIFTRGQLAMNSIDYYLAALAASDIFVDWCGLFVITVDSARRFSKLLTDIHLIIIPYILPVGYTAQMCSVYFTVFAAIDCYISIRRPASKFCEKRFTKSIIYSIVVCSFLYNCVTFLDLEIVDCVDYEQGMMLRQEICPTQLRTDPVYMQIYKVYCYALFMAFLPFALLLVLNVLIVYFAYRRSNASGRSEVRRPIVQHQAEHGSEFDDQPVEADAEQDTDSTMTLVMVVVLFLLCNSIGFAVNIVETFSSGENSDVNNVDDQIQLMFVVDAGNFLVVFNSSANFLIYAAFSKQFRRVLKKAWQKYVEKLANLIRSNNNRCRRRHRRHSATSAKMLPTNNTRRRSRTPTERRDRFQLSSNLNLIAVTSWINGKVVAASAKRRQARDTAADTGGVNIANEMSVNGTSGQNSTNVGGQLRDDTCLIIQNRNVATYKACDTAADNNRR